MLGTARQVEIGHIAVVHTFLDGEVEHGLLLAIVDASDTSLVTLLVVELQILDNAHRDVLQRRLHIAEHELLTVEQYLLHFLAVDGNVTVLVDLCPWNTLDEFLYSRAFRGTKGLWIIHDGVFPDYHLCGTARNDGFLQHDTLRFHHQVAQVKTLIATKRHLTVDGLVAYSRDTQAESACRWGLHDKVSPLVAHGTAYKSAVSDSKQLDGGLHHRLLQVSVEQLSADGQPLVFRIGLSQRSEKREIKNDK